MKPILKGVYLIRGFGFGSKMRRSDSLLRKKTGKEKLGLPTFSMLLEFQSKLVRLVIFE